MKTLRIALVIYIAAILLSACGGTPSEQPKLEGVTWKLTAINGEPPMAGTRPTLQFDGDRSLVRELLLLADRRRPAAGI